MTAHERDTARIEKVRPSLDADDHPQIAYILTQLEAITAYEPDEDEAEETARYRSQRYDLLRNRAFDIIRPYERRLEASS